MLTRNEMIEYLVKTGSRYWLKNSQALVDLPVTESRKGSGFETELVMLPEWASECCPDEQNSLLVFSRDIVERKEELYRYVDWWSTAFRMLCSDPEQHLEKDNGPVHSSAGKLKGIDHKLFDRAWVNRIFLFLRKWASVNSGSEEEKLFGLLPEPEIIMTHDIDAMERTVQLKIKQSVFHGFNIFRNIMNSRKTKGYVRCLKSLLFSKGGYTGYVKAIARMENERGIESVFFIHPAGTGKGFYSWLIDPSYELDARTVALFKELRGLGHKIGLHPSFCSWKDPVMIENSRNTISFSPEDEISLIRQHWLRFSFQDTWKAQAEAGLLKDYTLGFNDRPGFRNSSALEFQPYSRFMGNLVDIKAIPLVLMDSQIFNYQSSSTEQAFNQIDYYVNEILSVRGTASVLWHPHTMSDDYGWGKGYMHLLSVITGDHSL